MCRVYTAHMTHGIIWCFGKLYLYFYTLQNIYDYIGTYIPYTVLCTLHIPNILYSHNSIHPPGLVWANRSSKSTCRDQRTGFRVFYIHLYILYNITSYIYIYIGTILYIISRRRVSYLCSAAV